MESTFTVSTAAATTALTTLDRLKAELGITATDEDDYLTGMLDRLSAALCDVLTVASAEDGTVTLGRETLIETQRLVKSKKKLYLARYPTVSVTSIVENDVTLTTDDWRIGNSAFGVLERMSDDVEIEWPSGTIVVTHIAGWLLPGDSGRNLPFPIEDAIFDTIKGARFNRSRDPDLRSENILEGLYAYTLFDRSDASNKIPPDVIASISRYRRKDVA